MSLNILVLLVKYGRLGNQQRINFHVRELLGLGIALGTNLGLVTAHIIGWQ